MRICRAGAFVNSFFHQGGHCSRFCACSVENLESCVL